MSMETFDIVVVGGGPSGATAANDAATAGHHVLLLDRAGRIKPCGGAIPPRVLAEFDIPEELLAARVRGARIIAPSEREVAMPIAGDGFVGMVDREVFDEWLRDRAARNGAVRRTGRFERLERDSDGVAVIVYADRDDQLHRVRARMVIGADGARSAVAQQAVPGGERVKCVFAYHEIVEAPQDASFNPTSCDVHYDGRISPDFYGWVFPHGPTVSVGVGSAHKGFALRPATAELRARTGLAKARTIRREGAPIPMKPLRRWDNGRDVVLAGDAAGVVAPASGEGIFYAMTGGRLAARAAMDALTWGDARALAGARRAFMRDHGRVFWILGVMQWFWYRSDAQRERFVSICRDKDVQQLTWESYMNKRLVRRRPAAHVRIFFKDLAHLFRLVSP